MEISNNDRVPYSDKIEVYGNSIVKKSNIDKILMKDPCLWANGPFYPVFSPKTAQSDIEQNYLYLGLRDSKTFDPIGLD